MIARLQMLAGRLPLYAGFYGTNVLESRHREAGTTRSDFARSPRRSLFFGAHRGITVP
jgi:hypothetical protein